MRIARAGLSEGSGRRRWPTALRSSRAGRLMMRPTSWRKPDQGLAQRSELATEPRVEQVGGQRGVDQEGAQCALRWIGTAKTLYGCDRFADSAELTARIMGEVPARPV